MAGFGTVSCFIAVFATFGCFLTKGWKDVALVALMYATALVFLAAEVFS